MKFSNFLFITVILLFLSFNSCLRKEDFGDKPIINFISLDKVTEPNGIDNIAWIKIGFTDGNGDIGLNPADTFPPFNYNSEYHNNLFIKYFEIQNGIRTEVKLKDSTFTFNIRIENITPSGQNKSLKGEIETALNINNPTSVFDTISFDIYLYDRALNKSNVISTPNIKVNKKKL